jgi:hypothetical protein
MATASEILANRINQRKQGEAEPEGETSLGSLLRETASGALTVVGAVGNTLDLPASSLRDVLAGKNPLDQWLTPFSAKNRTTGRELLTLAGLRKNKETGVGGWLKDPMEGVYDVAGFAAEVVLDPLNPAKWAVGGALGATNMLRVVTKKSIKAAGKRGNTVARRILGDAQQPGLFGMSAYGEVADRVAGAGRTVRSWFDYRVMGSRLAESQQRLAQMTRQVIPSEDDVVARVTAALDYLDSEGFSMRATDNLDEVRRNGESVMAYFEGPLVEEINERVFGAAGFKRLPDKFRTGPLAELKKYLDHMQDLRASVHIKNTELVDEGVDYWPRQMLDALRDVIKVEEGNTWSKGNFFAAFTTNSQDNVARAMMLKGFKGATPMVNRVVTDKDIQSLVEEISTEPLVANTLVAQVEGTGVARHVKEFADSLDMSPKELWRDMKKEGLLPKGDKAYTNVEQLGSALTRYREFMQRKVNMGGQGPSRVVRTSKGYIYDDLLAERGTAVQFQQMPDGSYVPSNLPNNQNMRKITDPDVIDNLRQSMRTPEQRSALARAIGNDSLYTWIKKDGTYGYFTPRREDVWARNWNRRLQGLRKRIGEAPATQEEMVTDSIETLIRRKYGRYIDDNMPAAVASGNKDDIGKIRWRVLDEDGAELGEHLTTPREALDLMENQTDRMKAAERRGGRDLEPVYESRIEALSGLLYERENVREFGLFGNNPLIDFADRMKSDIKLVEVARILKDMTLDHFHNQAVEKIGAAGQEVLRIRPRAVRLRSGERTVGIKVGDVLKNETIIDRRSFLNAVRGELQSRGVELPLPPEGATKAQIAKFNREMDEVVEETLLPADVWGELNAAFEYFNPAPEAGQILGTIDWFQNIFKSNVLSNPRTVTRDGVSGLVMGFLRGDMPFGPLGIRRYRDAHALARGKKAMDAYDHTELRQVAATIGLDPNSQDDRQKAFRYLFTASMNHSNVHAQLTEDFAKKAVSGQADELLDALPGQALSKEGSIWSDIKLSVQRMWGENPTLTEKMAPWNVPGVPKRDPTNINPYTGNPEWVKRTTMNFPNRLHSAVRGHMDSTNRMAAISHLMLDQKKSFREAFERVSQTQLNYDPRRFSRLERKWLKRVFPFYSFISRSLPMVAMELVSHPGGGLGQMIRAQRMAQGDEDDFVPHNLQDTAAIPLGKGEDGELRYLANLGLMHEDALRYIAPVDGVRGMIRRVVGSMSPLVKGPIEYGTNTSTFFDGPMGGRRLDDLDPAIGRLLTNMGLRDLPPSGRPAPFGSKLIESIAANSPAAAYLSQLRVATDDPARRSASEKAMNLLLGFRTRIVEPEALARELRDRLNKMQVDMGAQPYTVVGNTDKLGQAYEEIGDAESAERLRATEQALRRLRMQLQKLRSEKAKEAKE